jgi:hypothetical protein
MGKGANLKVISSLLVGMYMVFFLILVLTFAACGDGQSDAPGFAPPPGDDNGVDGDEGTAADTSTWLLRESGLPDVLNDVAWDWRDLFIAVGEQGTIMTSPDGIAWTQQDSGTNADMHAITCDGWDCMAVGDSGTILFTQDGVTWTEVYDGPDNVSLKGLYHGFVPALVAGRVTDTGSACVFRHSDPNDWADWTEIEAMPQSGRSITGLAGSRGFDPAIFVATTQVETLPNDGRVLTSTDGVTWIEVVISTEPVSTLSIITEDDRFWVGATDGRIYSSTDGVNWTEYQTPAIRSHLSGLASSGTTLVAHGSNEAFDLRNQIGVSSSDGGETWQEFVIGNAYETRGLAYANGRFVSVGRSLPEPGEGAVYTTP